MHGEDFCRFGIQFDFLLHADIYLGEVALVEVALQHLALHEDVLRLEFLLRTEGKPCRVELLVLGVDGLRLL